MSEQKHLQFRLKELIARHERVTGERVTYRALAEATALSPGTITAIANNQNDRVALHTIERLLDYFGCDVGDLVVYE